jgi:dihydrofolate reductase
MSSAGCLTLIAAVARDGVIGLNNTLPWRLPEDFRRFKALTLGHPVVMGRKTWDSLGRPLPGRENIVITRDPARILPGASAVASLAQAIELAAQSAAGADEIFVIGGAEIYRLALPLAQRLQLTEIDANFAGDAHFPTIDRTLWHETTRETHHADAGFDYAFATYCRMGF